ncbi:HhH-GPD base excision DNA repair family protein [Medicago truncatula]|uniref:HhH-GPD base excision DNA repair family protein n=1 Tax=Medicago truncatula TaxID=3880 RepID=G7ITF2_MEDTR|nr:HhH-GPD base excision DNA repair family protein [Medicago truncatula]
MKIIARLASKSCSPRELHSAARHSEHVYSPWRVWAESLQDSVFLSYIVGLYKILLYHADETVEGSCPGMLCHSTVEGSCPGMLVIQPLRAYALECLVIQSVEGSCPGMFIIQIVGGWVPLQPLPESLQLHLLELNPLVNFIQKHLWARLSTLPYDYISKGLMYQKKTNCNACPMRADCRHFASAFASTTLMFPRPEQCFIGASGNSVTDKIPPVVMSQLHFKVNICQPIIEECKLLRGRAESFIARMHPIQGYIQFSRWKGSIVDLVVGVFLTQHVSDHLSCSAFMSLAAQFPKKSGSTCKVYDGEGTSLIVNKKTSIAKKIVDAIKERGMNNKLAKRVQNFLIRLVDDHGSIDLEWLRDVPPDQTKEYLSSIAFPIDTNVGRIAVRLGWVPLHPLPESLQLHLLELYPLVNSIQKHLWARLCCRHFVSTRLMMLIPEQSSNGASGNSVTDKIPHVVMS